MIDININHIEYLHSLFNYKNNIICIDFLNHTNIVFDVIISNPPYIINMNEFSSSKKRRIYNMA